MRSSPALLALLALSAAAAWTAPVLACLHGPEGYQGKVEESGQKAILVWSGGREELILKVEYVVRQGPAPERLAWVVPTPSTPDAYGVEEGNLFDELERQFAPPIKAMPQEETLALDSPRGGEIELLERVSVGPYDIQPIRAHGEAAGPALNEWLGQHQFSTVPLENMRWYLERDWTFLAIAVTPPARSARPGGAAVPVAPAPAGEPDGALRLDEAGDFAPLRISFASPRAVYPLKFSSHQGTFDVSLYVVTTGPLEGPSLGEQAAGFGFTRPDDGVPQTQEPGRQLSAALKKLVGEGRLPDGTWRVAKLRGERVNSASNPVSVWPEDFALALDGTAGAPATPATPAAPAPAGGGCGQACRLGRSLNPAPGSLLAPGGLLLLLLLLLLGRRRSPA